MHESLFTLNIYLRQFVDQQADTKLDASTSFSPSQLQSLLTELFKTLVLHLRNEMDTISIEKLAAKLDKESMREFNGLMEEAMKKTDPFSVLPGESTTLCLLQARPKYSAELPSCYRSRARQHQTRDGSFQLLFLFSLVSFFIAHTRTFGRFHRTSHPSLTSSEEC